MEKKIETAFVIISDEKVHIKRKIVRKSKAYL